MNPKKAPGIDNIPPFILKHLPANVVMCLTNINNVCCRIAHYPSPWKHAKLYPLKKPDKPPKNPAIYRSSISLLSCLAKILDEQIYSKVLEVADDNKLFSHFQYGFRASYSTTHQLFRVGELISTNNNRGHCTGLVSLDLEKAFDKVWHPGLIYKLQVLGYPARLVHIIRAYITNRTFRVSVQEALSPEIPLLSGIPQGSTLGPIFFNLYTCDIPLPKDHRTTIALYADDTAIITTSRDIDILHDIIQDETHDIINYYHDWGLQVNPTKTQYTIFTKRTKNLRTRTKKYLHININTIPTSPTLKYLGITFDQKLLFSQHIQNITTSARRRFCQLLTIIRNAPPKIANLIYLSYIRPILTYASPSWYPLIPNFSKMQILQNKALRLANNMPLRTRINELHNIAGVPLLEEFVDKTLIPKFHHSLIALENPTIVDSLTLKFPVHPKHPSLNYVFNINPPPPIQKPPKPNVKIKRKRATDVNLKEPSIHKS